MHNYLKIDTDGLVNTLTEKAALYAPKLLLAIAILVIGLWVIGKVVKMAGRLMEKREIDTSLQPFLKGLLAVLLKVMLFISIAGMVGVQTASFVGVLAALSFALGMALQGSLANFAGGVLLLIFKPYKVGDLIQAQDATGHVQSINVFHTELKTPDNKIVIIPNGPLANGNVTNFSRLGLLRVDLSVGIGYGDDIQKARNVIMTSLQNNPKVLKDPKPSVSVEELGDSSVNLAVRPYCKTADYWDVYFGCLENVKLALDENGVNIPYPHTEVILQKAD